MRIIIDVMSGDNAPLEILKGVGLAAAEYKDEQFVLVGNEEVIKKIASEENVDVSKMEIVHTEGVISMHDDPLSIARAKRDSSIVKGVKLLATAVEGVDMNGLRELGDQLKEKLGEGVVVLASDCDGKVNLIAMATDGAMKQGAHAGNLIKGIAALVGGGGGGRPNMAQAGGKNPAGIPQAIAAVADVLASQIK